MLTHKRARVGATSAVEVCGILLSKILFRFFFSFARSTFKKASMVSVVLGEEIATQPHTFSHKDISTKRLAEKGKLTAVLKRKLNQAFECLVSAAAELITMTCA